MRRSLVTILIIIPLISIYSQTQIVRIRDKQSKDDISQSYFMNLLDLALEATENEYGSAKVELVNIPASQGRVLAYLEQNIKIDIAWAGTNPEREEKFIPIRVPLTGGLLGYRVPVIRKDSVEVFNSIKNLDDLKKLSLIQGTHWPDSDILENAGFKVVRSPRFEQMYIMLQSGRADFFPRGLSEVYSEVESIGSDKLIAYDRIIIKYKFPMYFFVNLKNRELAKRIEKGLIILINQGIFIKNLESHPVTSPIFPLEKYSDSLIFEIENPDLTKATPKNEIFWIELP